MEVADFILMFGCILSLSSSRVIPNKFSCPDHEVISKIDVITSFANGYEASGSCDLEDWIEEQLRKNCILKKGCVVSEHLPWSYRTTLSLCSKEIVEWHVHHDCSTLIQDFRKRNAKNPDLQRFYYKFHELLNLANVSTANWTAYNDDSSTMFDSHIWTFENRQSGFGFIYSYMSTHMIELANNYFNQMKVLELTSLIADLQYMSFNASWTKFFCFDEETPMDTLQSHFLDFVRTLSIMHATNLEVKAAKLFLERLEYFSLAECIKGKYNSKDLYGICGSSESLTF